MGIAISWISHGVSHLLLRILLYIDPAFGSSRVSTIPCSLPPSTNGLKQVISKGLVPVALATAVRIRHSQAQKPYVPGIHRADSIFLP